MLRQHAASHKSVQKPARRRGQARRFLRLSSSIVGYARVSTNHQSLDQQRDALTAAGCERIFSDKLSGAREDRPGLAAMLEYVRPKDTVVVIALDRLGRSLSGDDSHRGDADRGRLLLRSLREGIDYSTPTGWMLAGIFAALAGYERELMHERAAAAREAARLRGRHTGRPARLTQAQAREVCALRNSGESISELVRSYGVSRATIYRACATATRPRPHRASSPRREPAASRGTWAVRAGQRLAAVEASGTVGSPQRRAARGRAAGAPTSWHV